MLSHPIIKYGIKLVISALVVCLIGCVLILIDSFVGRAEQSVNEAFRPSILSMIAARLIGGSPLIAVIWVWWQNSRNNSTKSYKLDQK